MRSLGDVIRWNEAHASEEMPYFRQELFEQAQATKGLKSKTYLLARDTARRLAGPEGIDRVMRKHRLAALVAPSGAPASAADEVAGEKHLGGSSQPAAIAGYPIISIPAGEAFGLPLGLSLFAGAGSEGRLLGFAYAFEQATHARQVPRFLPTLNLP